MEFLYILQEALVWIITIFWVYQLVISICSLINFKEKPILEEKTNKFMAIIPAHNEEAVVENAYITQGAVIMGEVRNSVIGTGCEVGRGAKVIDSVIQPGAKIGEGAKVTRCIVADNVEVAPGAVYGSADSETIELVAKKYAE